MIDSDLVFVRRGEAAYKSDFYVDDPGSFGRSMFMHSVDDA